MHLLFCNLTQVLITDTRWSHRDILIRLTRYPQKRTAEKFRTPSVIWQNSIFDRLLIAGYVIYYARLHVRVVYLYMSQSWGGEGSQGDHKSGSEAWNFSSGTWGKYQRWHLIRDVLWRIVLGWVVFAASSCQIDVFRNTWYKYGQSPGRQKQNTKPVKKWLNHTCFCHHADVWEPVTSKI